ncbi:hypothetical protein AB0B81_35760, partial [Streptomyces sp. NPDC039028]
MTTPAAGPGAPGPGHDAPDTPRPGTGGSGTGTTGTGETSGSDGVPVLADAAPAAPQLQDLGDRAVADPAA